MTQTTKLHYLFDPLCGWCYGASATIGTLSKNPDLDLKPLATGLFSGSGARSMKSFAEQAWANDQRISALSGQRFTEDYRRDVLGAVDAYLDSTVATRAVTAVADTAPDRVIDALRAIQSARYVKGKDVTSTTVVADLLVELNLADAAARILEPSDALLGLVRERTQAAQQLMAAYNLQGVPSLIAEVGGERRVLDSGTLYSGPDAVLAALQLA